MYHTITIHDVKGITVQDPQEGTVPEGGHYFVRKIYILGENGVNTEIILFSESRKGLLIRSEEE